MCVYFLHANICSAFDFLSSFVPFSGKAIFARKSTTKHLQRNGSLYSWFGGGREGGNARITNCSCSKPSILKEHLENLKRIIKWPSVPPYVLTTAAAKKIMRMIVIGELGWRGEHQSHMLHCHRWRSLMCSQKHLVTFRKLVQVI